MRQNKPYQYSSYSFPFASYPAVRIVLLFTAGILLDWQFDTALKIWLTVLTLLISGFFLANYISGRSLEPIYYYVSIFLYLLAIIFFGGFWHSIWSNKSSPVSQKILSTYVWESVGIKGNLYSIRQTGTGKYQLDIKTRVITISDSLKWSHSTNIRAVMDPGKISLPDPLNLGSRLHFEATVYPLEDKRNPHQFDYKQYLASQDIFTQVGIDTIRAVKPPSSEQYWNWYSVRQSTIDLINQNFGAATQSLAKALLIGYKNELDRNKKMAFSRAGLSHIMAVSGLHVGFLLAPFWFLIPFFWTFGYGRQAGFIILILLLLFYAGLTGFSASVSRASITGGLLMYARLFNKVRDSINLTAAAALIILLLNPSELFEIGFQLSFGAVYLILLIMPAVNRLLPASVRFRWYGKLFMIVIISIIVQGGLYPLLSFYFGEFSLIGPLANAVVIPVLTLVVPYALFLLPVSALFPTAGKIMNMPNEWFLAKLNQFVTTIASWEGSWVQTTLNDPLVFLLWLIAVFGIASIHIPPYRWRIAALFLALLCTQQVYQIIYKLYPATLKIVIFDVGQGDAALVTTPRNKHVLIDTGIRKPGYNSARYIIIPHLKAAGISKLDAVFLSHPHADHIGGMPELIDTIPIDTIYNSGYIYHSNLYSNYLQKAASGNIPVVSLKSGDRISLDSSLEILVYGPEKKSSGSDPNEHSLILELIYGDTEFLFMGDAGKKQERLLVDTYGNLLNTDFLKVGHHGSRTSSSRSFLSEVTADISVVSLAQSNRFGHPHIEATKRLMQSQTILKFTSLERAMIFVSDGNSIKQQHW